MKRTMNVGTSYSTNGKWNKNINKDLMFSQLSPYFKQGDVFEFQGKSSDTPRLLEVFKRSSLKGAAGYVRVHFRDKSGNETILDKRNFEAPYEMKLVQLGGGKLEWENHNKGVKVQTDGKGNTTIYPNELKANVNGLREGMIELNNKFAALSAALLSDGLPNVGNSARTRSVTYEDVIRFIDAHAPDQQLVKKILDHSLSVLTAGRKK